MLKKSQARKACEGTQKEAEQVGSHSQAKMCCSLGLTLKAGMLSNSEKGQKERKGEIREGGREEKWRNESRGDMCLTLKNSSVSNLHIYDHSLE